MPATTTTAASGAPPAALRAAVVPHWPSAPPWSSASNLVSCRPVQTSYRGSPQNQLLLHAPHGRHESTETEFSAPRALSTCPATTPPVAQLHSIALAHPLQRGAASGGKSQAARSLLISPHTSSGGYAAGPPTPGVCEAFSPALARSRAPEPHPSVALAVYGSTALQVPPNMLQTCRTMRRRLGDLARPRCERAPPRSSRACSYTFVHVAAGPATAIATTAATLATQSCSARLDGQ